MMQDVEFCLLAERGNLERQALLLCESIRQWCGRYASAPITVISPRRDRRPSSRSRQRFAELGAQYSELALESPTPQYGPSFRVLALASRSRQPGPRILVQLDSDTIFLDEPDLELGSHDAAARPVDLVGMCSTGAGDPREKLWQDMCRANGVELGALPYVHTTVGHRRVRASYNSGLFIASRGAYSLVEECFRNIVAADLRPFRGALEGMPTGAEFVTAQGLEMWGTSQAAISIASAKAGISIRVLDAAHNVPLHLLDSLDAVPARIVHLHYHWLFDNPLEPNPALDGRLHLTPAQGDWLRERLSLRTTTEAADAQSAV
jgi:hypothetical protein